MQFYIRSALVAFALLASLTAFAFALEVEDRPVTQVFDRNHLNLSPSTTPLINFLEPKDLLVGANIELSVDARASKILEEEVDAGKKKYGAKSGLGLILDVRSGEIIALTESGAEQTKRGGRNCDVSHFNNISEGVFEFGAAYKLMTLALALDQGAVNLDGKVDARTPLRFGRFQIHDYMPQGRLLSVPEVILYSSNIASARLARKVGDEKYKAFIEKIGIMSPLEIQYLKSAIPIYPREWTTLNTMTVAFGHGIAISPLHAAASVATLVNGGHLVKPTILKVSSSQHSTADSSVVIKEETSKVIRDIMRMNVENGTAKSADISSTKVGGVTTTSEKIIEGHYSPNRLQTSFFGVFPSNNPRYLVMIMLDEPQGSSETEGYATAAWNAAPIAAQVIDKVNLILDIKQN